MSDGNDVCCMLEILESSTNSDADQWSAYRLTIYRDT